MNMQISNNTESECNTHTCFRSYCLGNGCCDLCRFEHEKKCLVYGCSSTRFNVLEDQERFINGNQTKLDLHQCRKCKTVQEDVELPPEHDHAKGLNDTCKICVAHYAQILHPQGSKKKQQYAVKNPDGSFDLVDELGMGDPQTGYASSIVLDFLRKKELDMIRKWNFRFYHRRNEHGSCTIETNPKWSIRRHAKQSRENDRLYKVECSIPAFAIDYKCTIDGIPVQFEQHFEHAQKYTDMKPQLYTWQKKEYKTNAVKLMTHDYKPTETPFGKGKLYHPEPDLPYGVMMTRRMSKGDGMAYHELRRFKSMFNPEGKETGSKTCWYHRPLGLEKYCNCQEKWQLRGMNKTMPYRKMISLIKRYNQLNADLKYQKFRFHTCYETDGCLACNETESIFNQIVKDRYYEEPRFTSEVVWNEITGSIEIVTVDLNKMSQYKDDDRIYTGIEFPYTEQFPITLELIEAELGELSNLSKAPNGYNHDTVLVQNKRGVIHTVVSTNSTYAPNTNPEKDSHETSIDMTETCDDPKTGEA